MAYSVSSSGFSPLKKWGIVQIKACGQGDSDSFSPLKKWGIVQTRRRIQEVI